MITTSTNAVHIILLLAWNSALIFSASALKLEHEYSEGRGLRLGPGDGRLQDRMWAVKLRKGRKGLSGLKQSLGRDALGFFCR